MTTLGEAWESTPAEQRRYASYLTQAGQKRAYGLCLAPNCGNLPASGTLTCNDPACVEFVATAPAGNVAHWQQIAVALAWDTEVLDTGTVPALTWWDKAEVLLLVTSGGVIGGATVLAVIAVGLWLGRLWIMRA